jgi:hypothetical protein
LATTRKRGGQTDDCELAVAKNKNSSENEARGWVDVQLRNQPPNENLRVASKKASGVQKIFSNQQRTLQQQQNQAHV